MRFRGLVGLTCVPRVARQRTEILLSVVSSKMEQHQYQDVMQALTAIENAINGATGSSETGTIEVEVGEIKKELQQMNSTLQAIYEHLINQ